MRHIKGCHKGLAFTWFFILTRKGFVEFSLVNPAATMRLLSSLGGGKPILGFPPAATAVNLDMIGPFEFSLSGTFIDYLGQLVDDILKNVRP